MHVAVFCFVIASLAALAGMGLGIFMGINQDFTLSPVHAHINLLGWVTLALYGLYHRGVARASNRLAWAQVGLGAAGFVLLSAALAGTLLTHDPRLVPLTIAGSLLSVAGMALFLAVVIADARARTTGAIGGAARLA